jgi:hypothetical protein
MSVFELRARCPRCRAERSAFGPRAASTPAELDAMEAEIDRCGGVVARCLKCNAVESVALFVDGKQTEPWQDADAYEKENGSAAGDLPPKPW